MQIVLPRHEVKSVYKDDDKLVGRPAGRPTWIEAFLMFYVDPSDADLSSLTAEKSFSLSERKAGTLSKQKNRLLRPDVKGPVRPRISKTGLMGPTLAMLRHETQGQ